MKLDNKVKEWKRQSIPEIEIRDMVVEKIKEIIESYKIEEKEVEIEEDLLDDWMYQPLSLVVNKKEKSFSFIFEEEAEFLMDRVVPDNFYPDDDGVVSFEIPSDIYYEFDKDTGELYLSGKGNMPNYYFGHEITAPWDFLRKA